jgi:hypothetical protein
METITISARGPMNESAPADSAERSSITRNAPIIAQAGEPSASRRPGRAQPLDVGTMLLGIGALVLLAAIVPIAAGFSNIIGLIIIGIALFEAWKLNRRTTLDIKGPYRLGADAAGAGAVG